MTPEFAQVQILSLRCINPAQLTKGGRNLKSVALKMAKISSIQISTNDHTATPRADGACRLWYTKQPGSYPNITSSYNIDFFFKH
jgi:hypothetical protein